MLRSRVQLVLLCIPQQKVTLANRNSEMPVNFKATSAIATFVFKQFQQSMAKKLLIPRQ